MRDWLSGEEDNGRGLRFIIYYWNVNICTSHVNLSSPSRNGKDGRNKNELGHLAPNNERPTLGEEEDAKVKWSGKSQVIR